MGRRIDRTVLWGLCATAFYLFFLNAWGSIPLACALAFAACALTRKLARRSPFPRRCSCAQARAALMRIAALPEDEAAPILEGLVRRRWPGEAFRLVPLLKHPEASVSSGDILNAWKANRDGGRLVIAATCPCEPRAALYARELRDPAAAMLDSRVLLRLLRSDPDTAAQTVSPPPLRQRMRAAFARICTARVTPRNALPPLVLLVMYALTGNPYSLFSALLLLAHLGAALIQRRLGSSMTDEI